VVLIYFVTLTNLKYIIMGMLVEDKDSYNEEYYSDTNKSLISESSILEIGFIKHSEYTYKYFKNNVVGYLDEIEVFFEPNEEISIIIRQTNFNLSDIDRNSIFIRNMTYIDELKSLINIICG